MAGRVTVGGAAAQRRDETRRTEDAFSTRALSLVFWARHAAILAFALSTPFLVLGSPRRWWLAWLLAGVVLPYSAALHLISLRRRRPTQVLAFVDPLLAAGAPLLAEEVWTSALLVGLAIVSVSAILFRRRIALGSVVLGALAFTASGAILRPPDVAVHLLTFTVLAPAVAVAVGLLGSREREARTLARARSNRLAEAEQRQRRLLGELLMARDRERDRIAIRIHEDTLQMLTAVGIHIQRLRKGEQEPDRAELLRELDGSIAGSISGLRELLGELRPPELYRDGLGAALRLDLVQAQVDSGVEIRLTDRMDGQPSHEARSVAYRIAKEAMDNVRQHAGAARVDVELASEDEGVLVRITDDGRGFNTPAHDLGLIGMEEWAQVAGGWWTLVSEPDEGTTVEFWIPDRLPNGRT